MGKIMNPKTESNTFIKGIGQTTYVVRFHYGENVPMQTGTGQDMPRPYVFYHNTCSEYLLDRLDDVYIVMMPQCSTLIPHFYVLVNQSMNEMHLLLLCLKEDLQGF